MSKMELYAVVKRTEEKDELLAYIDAMSLREAEVIFEVRHTADVEEMQKGEEILIYHAEKALVFDENNRIEMEKGSIISIYRFYQ